LGSMERQPMGTRPDLDNGLMQACLLRDVGLDTDRAEELMTLDYQSWPVP